MSTVPAEFESARSVAGEAQSAVPASRLLVEQEAALVELQLEVGDVLLGGEDGDEGPIPHCCRSAGCGTCRVEVLSGAEHLTPPAEAEIDVLDIYGADPSRVRLACQARICAGAITVRVRPLER